MDTTQLQKTFEADKAGQAGQNAAANAVNSQRKAEQDARFNHASTGQRGNFQHPQQSGRSGKK